MAIGGVTGRREGSERWGAGEDRGLSVGADLPDEVRDEVGHIGFASAVDGDVIYAVDEGGGGGRERGEEELPPGAEVVAGESMDHCEEAVVRRVDGAAEEGGVGGEGAVVDEGLDGAGGRDGVDGAFRGGSRRGSGRRARPRRCVPGRGPAIGR